LLEPCDLHRAFFFACPLDLEELVTLGADGIFGHSSFSILLLHSVNCRLGGQFFLRASLILDMSPSLSFHLCPLLLDLVHELLQVFLN
jgi:hypothetical protein